LTTAAIRSLFSEFSLSLLLSEDIKIASSASIWRLGYNKNLSLKELRNFALFESEAKMSF
jgi:hypothetical protein